MQADPIEPVLGASGVSGSRSSRSFHWIADRNPFYLLSACCGLVGCWLLGDLAQQDVADAAMRIVGILAYELAVVSLGVWLAKQAGMQRDAAILSVLTLVLIADFSFFYTQAAMLKPAPASLFSFFGAAQALVVVSVLLQGFRIGLSKPARWLLAVDLFAVHLLPLALRLSAENAAGLPLAFLAAFAAAGALVAAHAWPTRWRAEISISDSPAHTPDDLSRALAVIAPVVVLVSLAAHLIAVEWIYGIEFLDVFASPLCLGVASVCLRREAARGDASAGVTSDGVLMGITPGGWSCVLAVLAVFLASGNPPAGAVWDANGWSWFGISPLRLALIAASAVLWAHWRMRRGIRALFLACGGAALAALGHTPESIHRHAGDLYGRVTRLLSHSLPMSRTGWGALLFVLAFLLLGAGAWMSWRKTRALDSDRKDPSRQ
jgi:hypothetical protein